MTEVAEEKRENCSEISNPSLHLSTLDEEKGRHRVKENTSINAVYEVVQRTQTHTYTHTQ